jgi:hypothetical protein
MTTCQNCIHWKAFSQDDVEDHEYHFERYAKDGLTPLEFGHCALAENRFKQEGIQPRKTLAWAEDGEEYVAKLVTHQAFGCTQGEMDEEKPLSIKDVDSLPWCIEFAKTFVQQGYVTDDSDPSRIYSLRTERDMRVNPGISRIMDAITWCIGRGATLQAEASLGKNRGLPIRLSEVAEEIQAELETKEVTGVRGDCCLICGKPVPDYVAEMCCSGFECGCRGVPTNPCTCSGECDDALFDNIGLPFEERRIKAGIARWNTPVPNGARKSTEGTE